MSVSPKRHLHSPYEPHERRIQPESEDFLSQVAHLVPPGVRVLDLESSTGALGRFLREQKGCLVDGLEVDREVTSAARPFYRQVVEADLETCELRNLFPAHAYDVIVCADVLQHLRDPDRVLKQLPELLTPEAKLLLSI